MCIVVVMFNLRTFSQALATVFLLTILQSILNCEMYINSLNAACNVLHFVYSNKENVVKTH